MRIFSSCFCLLLLLPVLLAGAGERLRVMSLNAEWFPGRAPRPTHAQQTQHLADVQRLLRDVDADLLLFQEIVKSDALEKALAEQPDVSLYAISAFTNNPLQLAVAGRLPHVAAEAGHWAIPPDYTGPVPPRGIAFAAVELPEGSLLLLFSLHLKSNYRGKDYHEQRNVQMREGAIHLFLAYAAAMERRFSDRRLGGILLGGDLNTLYPRSFIRGERTVNLLESGGFEHLGSNGLDHFWGKGIGDVAFSVFKAYKVSDHAPIILDITLDGEGASRRQPVEETRSSRSSSKESHGL